ncbi:MAG: TetR/AcrR family transcriptional regulator, partial [Verrucomicrobiota bacterium]
MPRPRTTSEDEAIEQALMLFWEHGYDRTSIALLCEAIGVGPSSLYNAFGSKEELFRRAIGRYVKTYAACTREVADTESPLSVVEFAGKLMRDLAMLYTTGGKPLGCAIFRGGSPDSNSESGAITREVKQDLETALRQRFQSYADRGEPLSAPPATLARFILSTLC